MTERWYRYRLNYREGPESEWSWVRVPDHNIEHFRTYPYDFLDAFVEHWRWQVDGYRSYELEGPLDLPPGEMTRQRRVRHEYNDVPAVQLSPAELKDALSYLRHTRNSCSDDDPRNGYTTSGRGGAPRCDRCALLNGVGFVSRRVTITVTLPEED